MSTKLFVGMLPEQASDSSLYALFSQYGNVIEATVMRNASGISRGFGFVLFENLHDANSALAQPLFLDGKKIAPQIATPKKHSVDMHSYSTNKLFVSSIHPSLSAADIKSYFSTWGNITNILFKEEQATGKSRGFCFVTFEESSQVDKIVSFSKHVINGYRVTAGKAEPRKAPRVSEVIALPSIDISSSPSIVPPLIPQQPDRSSLRMHPPSIRIIQKSRRASKGRRS